MMLQNLVCVYQFLSKPSTLEEINPTPLLIALSTKDVTLFSILFLTSSKGDETSIDEPFKPLKYFMNSL